MPTRVPDKPIRVMDRMGLVYSFEALRAEIFFTKSVHAKKKHRLRFERKELDFDIGRRSGNEMHDMLTTLSRFTLTPLNQQYGPEVTLNSEADISTMVKLIEEGKL